jgi:NADPH:quinone reductase-like Zn-dependent oxidoreductase
MRAVWLTGHGGLECLDFRDDVPVPRPGWGDVLVRVHACAVNNTEINTRVGWYGATVDAAVTEAVAINGIPRDASEPASWNRERVHFPRIQGAASAGEIVAVGGGVGEERIGNRVVVDPVIRDLSLKRWARGVEYLGSERDGGFADYLVAPSVNALTAPETVSFAELACLPCAFQTAEEMQTRTRVTSGDRVVVSGASGGVGLANVLLAKLRGARVVAIGGASKVEALLRQGADDVVVRDGSDFLDQLRKKIGTRGADVVLDVVGGELVRPLWDTLDRAGRYATAGAIAGPQVSVDIRDLIYKDLEMYGIAFPEAEALKSLVAYAEAGRLRPVIDRVCPLERMREAQALFAAKRHVGKIVITLTS